MALSTALLFHSTWNGPLNTLGLPVLHDGAAGRIILMTSCEAASTTPVSLTSVTGLGVTWTRRQSQLVASGTGQACEEWYADVPSSWTDGTITGNFSGNFDAAVAAAFKVTSLSGGQVAFDTNASIPAKLANTGTASLSTNSSSPYVIMVAGHGALSNAGGISPASLTNTTSGSASNVDLENTRFDWGQPGQLSATTTGYTSGFSSNFAVLIDALAEVATGNMLALMDYL